MAQKNESRQLTIGTHSGTFHCDEVLACFMLRQLPEYKNAPIIRSRDSQKLHDECDIIVDVGGIFDHNKKMYDHHQKSFQETLGTLRPDLEIDSTIRLSSAGLIYSFYGERIIESILQQANISLSQQNLKLSFVQIYKNFISEIDAIDNGIPMLENGTEPLYKISTHLSARIGKLNPSWEEDTSKISELQEQGFNEAMAAAGREFMENVIDIGGSWIRAREHVRKALLSAKDVHESGEILFLERFCPWKIHLDELEKELKLEGVPKLVIFSENTQSWRVMGVPVTPSSFIGRKFLPIPWRGLRDQELSNIANIDNLIFVHYNGFIGGAGTKEAAIAMAIRSIEWQDIN